jgi:hypothetical protein
MLAPLLRMLEQPLPLLKKLQTKLLKMPQPLKKPQTKPLKMPQLLVSSLKLA